MLNDEPAFTFRAVQVFVAAVDAQSVTRAAHRMGLSPSSVSQQLSNLEASLGAKLIVRSARTFRLTEAGALFLDRAKRLLDEVGAAKAELALADHAPPMTLRLASIEEMDATVMAPLLRRLTDTYPNIAFSLSSGASHENHDALASRAVDLMLAVDTVGDADWVERHAILQDPFILVRGAGVKPMTGPGDMTGAPFIRYSGALEIGRRIEAQLRRTDLRPPRRYEVTGNRALFETVAALDGCAITTALAFLGTPLIDREVEAQALPFPAFSRRLFLQGRTDALGDLPGRIADEMRGCLRELVLPKVRSSLPFLGAAFDVASIGNNHSIIPKQ